MRRYTQDDYGYYAVEFFDELGNPVTPDWNATLYFEFYDSAGVLQFTATTTSTPVLQTSGTAYVFVEEIPLTGWAVGVVTARVYGQLAGVDFEPSPLVASAFEIVLASDLVEQLRLILHLDDHSEDAFLLTLIESAADYAEKYLARSLLTQDRVKQVQAPQSSGLSVSTLKVPTVLLTYPPVVDITRVYTVDEDGDEDDLDDYWLDDVSDPPELHLDSYSWSNLLRVNYQAGYGASYDDLPDAIRRGILLHAAHLYKYRGDCEIQESAQQSGAIGAYRIYKIVRRG